MSLYPLETEEAWPIGNGRFQLDVSSEFQSGNILPFDTINRDRDITRFLLGVNLGVGERIELEARYDLIHLDEDGGVNKTGSGDLRLATKVGIYRSAEGDTEFGLRFGVKLPNANKQDRLGTDETDFFASFLASKEFTPLMVDINLGVALLGDPQFNGGQDDILIYGLAFVLPFSDLELIGELNGRLGSMENNNRNVVRTGIRWKGIKDSIIYCSVGVGLNDESEDWSVSIGYTRYMDLF